MNFPKFVNLCEVGPRDGLQAAKRKLPAKEKAYLIDRSVEAGFKAIEFGAFTPFQNVKNLDDSGEVYTLINRIEGIQYRALVSGPDDIKNAASFGVSLVKVTLFANERIGGRSIDENLKNIDDCCNTAQSLKINVLGSISLPFNAPVDGVTPIEIVERIISRFAAGGIRTVSLSDAGGLANPRLVYERTIYLKEKFPDLTWILHLHDTWGMGYPNMIAGLDAGVTNFDVSFAGLGGCPFIKGTRGNIASEQTVFILEQMGIKTGIDLEKTLKLAEYVSTLDLGVTKSAYLSAKTGA